MHQPNPRHSRRTCCPRRSRGQLGRRESRGTKATALTFLLNINRGWWIVYRIFVKGLGGINSVPLNFWIPVTPVIPAVGWDNWSGEDDGVLLSSPPPPSFSPNLLPPTKSGTTGTAGIQRNEGNCLDIPAKHQRGRAVDCVSCFRLCS